MSTLKNKRVSKSSGKSSMLSYTPSKMVSMFLQILNVIKLFHWKTTDYAVHKATDELHSSLSDRIDAFVEQLMGALNTRINIDKSSVMAYNCSDLNDLLKHIKAFKIYLTNYMAITGIPPNTQYHLDLATLRDEMIGIVDKFLYLSSLH